MCTKSGKISVGYRSLETILRLSLNKFVFLLSVLPEGDRGESRGGNFEFGIGLCMGFELCWNYVFDLRIVQRDF